MKEGGRNLKLDYKTYAEAAKKFTYSERWEVFSGNRDSFNIAYECVDRHPKEKIAVRLQFAHGGRETYTFAELSRLTAQFAGMLEDRGIGRGDRVAIILNPSLEFYAAFFGTLKKGAVAVPCFTLFGPEAIEFRVKNSGARMMVTNKEKASIIKRDMVEHLIIDEELPRILHGYNGTYTVNTAANDLAVIQFSSGTTGSPKPVYYNHIAATLTAVNIKFCIGLREDDNYFCPSSPAWGHGIWYGTVGPLIFGNAIGAYSGKFEAETLLGALEHFETTNISAAPLVYRRIMTSGKFDHRKLKSLRRMTFSGGATDMDTIQYFRNRSGIFPQSFYGSTEVGVIVLDYAFADYEARPGSMGKAMLGIKAGIIDENGNELPPGQRGQMAVWRNGKWVGVGDIAFMDEDGYFWHVGRSDDIIISAGYTIGPFEIEEVLEKHPAVVRAAVVGVPDKERGEVVKAFIVPNREPGEDLMQDIQEFVKTQLSKHEYPRKIEFVDQLPETPDGKIKRKELKRRG
ncbi:MAG: acetate--CoA ligase [Peptococcaceae bacterium]|nr:MAG: acetate--CoA ligase [Peptococcaceae bacterium]